MRRVDGIPPEDDVAVGEEHKARVGERKMPRGTRVEAVGRNHTDKEEAREGAEMLYSTRIADARVLVGGGVRARRQERRRVRCVTATEAKLSGESITRLPDGPMYTGNYIQLTANGSWVVGPQSIK